MPPGSFWNSPASMACRERTPIFVDCEICSRGIPLFSRREVKPRIPSARDGILQAPTTVMVLLVLVHYQPNTNTLNRVAPLAPNLQVRFAVFFITVFTDSLGR